MKTIVLGVTGSIAAYKAADLVSQLTKKGYLVHVLMTDSATKFITPLTLQTLSKNPVHTDILVEEEARKIQHIDLAKICDLFIIAPASANILAKLAHGIADDMLSTTALALPNIPKLIAPAMNTTMYQQAIVQHNLQTLASFDYQIIEPKESLLACGDYGKGALADLDTILATVEALLPL